MNAMSDCAESRTLQDRKSTDTTGEQNKGER